MQQGSYILHGGAVLSSSSPTSYYSPPIPYNFPTGSRENGSGRRHGRHGENPYEFPGEMGANHRYFQLALHNWGFPRWQPNIGFGRNSSGIRGDPPSKLCRVPSPTPHTSGLGWLPTEDRAPSAIKYWLKSSKHSTQKSRDVIFSKTKNPTPTCSPRAWGRGGGGAPQNIYICIHIYI